MARCGFHFSDSPTPGVPHLLVLYPRIHQMLPYVLMRDLKNIPCHTWIKQPGSLPLRSNIKNAMKKDIHPANYRYVVFKDFSCDFAFLTKSCAPTKDTITWEDGKEYPLIKLEISSQSHPFFTGKMKFVDTAGRIDKFNKKFANSKFAKKEAE
jgi:large subunit ribosomal protein L31